MGEPKLTLNIRSPNGNGEANLAKAAKTKRDNSETTDEAWARILAMKNSGPDERRLKEVKAAVDAGKIGREPESAGRRFSKAEALRLHSHLMKQERENTLRKLVENTPDNYKLIRTLSDLDFLNQDIKASDLIAFDVETYSKV